MYCATAFDQLAASSQLSLRCYTNSNGSRSPGIFRSSRMM
jgi:hypothetical protein